MADRQGFEEAALARIAQQLDPMADATAGQMGMPPGAKRYTAEDELVQWNYSPIASPQVRVETMIELHAAGKSLEEITDAVYPNRRRLITTGRTRPDEQIAFAKQMASLMQKKAAEQAPTPQPMPVSGTVPMSMDTMPMGTPPAPMAPAPPAPMPAAAPVPVSPPSILDQPLSMMGG